MKRFKQYLIEDRSWQGNLTGEELRKMMRDAENARMISAANSVPGSIQPQSDYISPESLSMRPQPQRVAFDMNSENRKNLGSQYGYAPNTEVPLPPVDAKVESMLKAEQDAMNIETSLRKGPPTKDAPTYGDVKRNRENAEIRRDQMYDLEIASADAQNPEEAEKKYADYAEQDLNDSRAKLLLSIDKLASSTLPFWGKPWNPTAMIMNKAWKMNTIKAGEIQNRIDQNPTNVKKEGVWYRTTPPNIDSMSGLDRSRTKK